MNMNVIHEEERNGQACQVFNPRDECQIRIHGKTLLVCRPEECVESFEAGMRGSCDPPDQTVLLNWMLTEVCWPISSNNCLLPLFPASKVQYKCENTGVLGRAK